jgi:uncharacterized membrane protein HdeD (DUF308 family)
MAFVAASGEESGTANAIPTKLMSRPWWELVIRGLLVMAFGAVAILLPDPTISQLITFFGVLVFMEGIFQMMGAFNVKVENPQWILMLIGGTFSFMMGVIALSWLDITDVVLLWIIAAWALINGTILTVFAGKALEGGGHVVLLLIGGIVGIIFGLVAFIWPEQTALTLVTVIGTFAIVIGVLSLAGGLASRGRS